MNYLLFSLLASFWGGSFVAIKASLEAFPPVFSASMRVSTALVAIWFAYKILKIDTKVNIRQKLLCYGLGFFSITLPFSLLFWGEQFVNAGLAGVINGTTPIWTFLSAYYIFQTEKSSVLNNILGIAVSFAGIFLIFSPQLNFNTTAQELWGILAIFGMAASYGFASNMAKRVMSKDKVDNKVAVFHQHVFACVSLLVLALVFEGSEILALKTAPMKSTLAIVYLGVFSTGIAYFILYHLLGVWGPIKAMSVTYLIPVMALSFDYLFYGNTFLPIQFMGVILISFGLVILQNPKLITRFFVAKPKKTSC